MKQALLRPLERHMTTRQSNLAGRVFGGETINIRQMQIGQQRVFSPSLSAGLKDARYWISRARQLDCSLIKISHPTGLDFHVNKNMSFSSTSKIAI